MSTCANRPNTWMHPTGAIAIEIPCTAEAVHTWLNGQIIAHYGGAEAVHSIRSKR